MRLGIKILHLHLTVTYVAETYFDPLFAISHYFEQLVGLLIAIGWLKNRSEEIIMN